MRVTSFHQTQAFPEDRRYILVSNISQKAKNASVAGTMDGEKLAIVIPTLNECDNINNLVPQIEEIFKINDINGHIIIVDDHSKDGTGEAAKQLARTFRNITVIERPGKLGLGSAYRCGFKHALAMNMDIIMEMDADLSHRPEYIPEFLKTIKNTGAGLVIGSRYIASGASKDWPLQRKMISYGANLATKMILGLNAIQDKTAGFRAYRAQVLRDIHYETLLTNGYAFQIEILHRTIAAGYDVKEIPIVFYEREIGESKLGKKDVKEYMIFFVRSAINRVTNFLTGDLFSKFFKFCIVGFIGLLFVLGIGYITKLFTTDHEIFVITNTIATVLAMVLNFTLNKIWSFRDKQAAVKRQLLLDMIGRTISAGFNFIVVSILVNYWWVFVVVAGVAVQVLFNFVLNKFIVFRKLNIAPKIKTVSSV